MIRKCLHWLRRETINIIPAIIYFLIAFNLIYYTVGLSLPPGEHRYVTPFMVNLAALIVGKVLLISNAFPLINAFLQKPRIYNILWKLFIYMLFTFVIWTLDAMHHLSKKLPTLAAALHQLLLEMTSALFWSSILWLLMIFMVFILFSELINLSGKGQVLRLLFGKREGK